MANEYVLAALISKQLQIGRAAAANRTAGFARGGRLLGASDCDTSEFQASEMMLLFDSMTLLSTHADLV
jgi:hypothetical protein